MKLFHRTLAPVLSFLLICFSFGHAHAAVVGNGQLIHQVQQANDRDALLQTISRADVQEQLLAMGVTMADIESRINQMTQEEVAQLNLQIDQMPAGGGVLGVALVVFIVFVVTDVIGATDIFPFIHSVNK